MQPLTSIRTPLPVILLLMFALDSTYQIGIRHIPLGESLMFAGTNALVYTAVLWASLRLDLAKVTLLFLATPYLIFISGWLNPPTALLSLTIFLYCIRRSISKISACTASYISASNLLAFLLIAMIVNVSGAGGYGFQWDDYTIHNARLKDLVEMTWPVRYGDNQNFVYYFGYFLPGALIGKITSLDVAFHCMYVWTLLGTTLALRWLAHLAKWQFSPKLVLIFILFGPYDILNVLITSDEYVNSLRGFIFNLAMYSDKLNFNLSYEFSFFIGNYLSNAFSLYWSPQQIVAGWLVTGMLLHLYLEKKYDSFVFIYALLCLWAPLVMIALLPLIIMATFRQTFTNINSIITPQNTLGSATLLVLFVVFYLGGSANANPSFWITDRLLSIADWMNLLLLFLSGWGIYSLAILPFIRGQREEIRYLYYCLIFSLAALPWKTFGEWGDLLCRGSSPLMFILLFFLLQAVQHYWNNQRKTIAAALLLLLIPGTVSSLIINASALANYGRTQPVASIISYPNAYPNLGPDNTQFAQWFRRQLPEKN